MVTDCITGVVRKSCLVDAGTNTEAVVEDASTQTGQDAATQTEPSLVRSLLSSSNDV